MCNDYDVSAANFSEFFKKTKEDVKPIFENYFDPQDNIQIGASLLSGTLIDGSISWHAGNDGAGSGLHADLLDGEHVNDLASSVNGSGNRQADDSNLHQGLTPQQVANLAPPGGVEAANVYNEDLILQSASSFTGSDSYLFDVDDFGGVSGQTTAVMFAVFMQGGSGRFGWRLPGQNDWKWSLGSSIDPYYTTNPSGSFWVPLNSSGQVEYRFHRGSGDLDVVISLLADTGDPGGSSGGGGSFDDWADGPDSFSVDSVNAINNSDSDVSVSWDSLSNRYGTDYYNVYDDGSVVETVNSGTTSVTYTQGRDGSTHEAWVTAVANNGNESPDSNHVNYNEPSPFSSSHGDCTFGSF